MDSNVYYDRNASGLLVTSNIGKFYKKMELGIFPKINYEIIDYEKINQYFVKDIAFDEIDNLYFQSVRNLFSKCTFDTVAFHDTYVELSTVVINARCLIVGENTKIDFFKQNFNNLKEVTFLSVKKFNGKIVDVLKDVEKLVLWYENKKSNTILEKFPDINDFRIYNGSIIELNLTGNPKLVRLQLHRCLKLQKVVLVPSVSLRTVIVESCNKLDVSNLGNNLTRR